MVDVFELACVGCDGEDREVKMTQFFFSEHDKRIHECATEIENLPVKPPYGELGHMLTDVLEKWFGRGDGHLGGVEEI